MNSQTSTEDRAIDLTPKGEAYIAALKLAGCPAGVEPRLWRDTVSRRANWHLDRATRLLALLDRMDGDWDIEESGDEHDLSATADWHDPMRSGYRQLCEDDEPSLGGAGHWTDAGLTYDLEEDRCDDEEDGTKEHSLGWSTSIHQGAASMQSCASESSAPRWGDWGGSGGTYGLSFEGEGYQVGNALLATLPGDRCVRVLPGRQLEIIAPGIARIL